MHKLLFYVLCIVACLTLHAQSGVIKTYQINGTEKTNKQFLERILAIDTLQELDSLALQKDITRLNRLPGIANARFEILKINEGVYEVIYHVEESFTIIPTVNIWSTDNVFSYKIGVYDFNFLGRNISVGGFYQFNGFSSYGINFRAPNLLGRKWGIAINHQNWTSEEPVFFSEGSANYRYSNTAIEVLGLYEFNFKNRVEFGVNAFTEKYDLLSGSVPDNIPASLNLNKLLFKSIYTFDNLRYDYQYVEGFKSDLYIQYVITKNSVQDDFLIAWNDFFYYKRFGIKTNWANRLRFGVSSNDETPFAPFSVDNNVNIRGVGFIIDRGTASLVLNTELRHTLMDKSWFVLQSNVFLDMGTWRNPGGDFSDFADPDNFRIYPGIGLRFMHKKIFNAIFRIDYGYGISKNANQGIVFGIGQYF